MRADYIVKNARVFQTFRQCFETRDVAVRNGKIYEVMPELAAADPSVPVYDAGGRYMIPGLIDIHMHIESSMTYPEEFSRIALRHGTTTVAADAHEIANVFGMEGLDAFLRQETAMDIFYAIPSSVPATDLSLETSGGVIGLNEVETLLSDERILCLGEVMNFKSLVPEDDRDTLIRRMIRLCQEKRGRDIRLEGHCPKITGLDLNHFIYEGVDADHTQQTPESVLEKTELGMFLELQLKSLTPDVVKTVCENHLYENVALITDDTMPDRLLNGQLNHILRTAVQAGMPAEKAIYCATWTPARRMHLDDRGMIAPGKIADFLLLSDLEGFRPEVVVKSGRVEKDEAGMFAGNMDGTVACGNTAGDAERVAFKEQHGRAHASVRFPEHFFHSVDCRPAQLSDFVLRAEKPCEAVLANVMQISTFGTATKQVQRRIPVRDGVICWQEAGLSLAVLYERHGKNGNVAYGLVEGAFTKPGAAATTWSHDSHNLMVLGTSPEDMLAAQHRVIELQGGYVTAAGGSVIAEAELSVGGILSAGPVESLAESLGRVRQAMRDLGYENNNEIMSMSTLALPVSPALKMTDYGLLDVRTQESVPLVVEYL